MKSWQCLQWNGIFGIRPLGVGTAEQEIGCNAVEVGHILKAVYGWGLPFAFPGTERRLGNAELFGGFNYL